MFSIKTPIQLKMNGFELNYLDEWMKDLCFVGKCWL